MRKRGSLTNSVVHIPPSHSIRIRNAKCSKLRTSNIHIEERTPLEVLKSGDIERLVALARGVGG